VDLLIRGKKGEELRRTITLSGAETTIRLACGFEIEQVIFDPDNLLLKIKSG